jgi:hypothetical protein
MSDLDRPAPADDDLIPGQPGPADESGERESAGTGSARRRGLLRLAPWVLLVLALAVAVTSTVQWQQLAAAEAERDEVEASAGSFMLALTTWDASEGMAATREQLREAGTERFGGEVDELFGTTEDLAGLEDIGARSQGEVRRSFVQEVDGDRARALIVVSQRLTADVLDGEEASVRYAELDLVRTGGRWLVDDVELLVDVATQDAQADLGDLGDLELEGAP